MRNESQLRIILLLQYLYRESNEQHPVSVSDILSEWERHGIHAGRKSVYGDIRLLNESGTDIVCTKGTQNHYFIGSRLFELPELKLLMDAVGSSQFISKKKSAGLIRKLSALACQKDAEQLCCLSYMDGSVKSPVESSYYTADTIQTAIRAARQILFQYMDYTARKERTLKHDGAEYVFSPYALIWQGDRYYTVGWSERHGKIAQFRVDRMVNVKLTDRPSKVSADFDITQYASRVFGMYGGECRRITLLCENGAMRSVVDHFGEEVETEIVDSTHFRAIIEAVPSPPFFSWVFTFCGRIRIAGPEDVLDEMRKMADWLR